MIEAPRAEQLVQDIAWLKRLATRLATDRDDADDLVQEAWIAAWRRQPDASRSMRAWLTKVVRDLAGMKRRSERRRAARDAIADHAERPAAPDELLAQIRLHKRLAELVIELDEPYRSTIIARFVEGRTSAAIAQSLGIPAGTVRKRLHEALERLRAGLDASAGERTRWAPSVVAFATGGMHVAKHTKAGLAALVALLVASAVTVMFVIPLRGGDVETPALTLPGVALRGASVTADAIGAREPLRPTSEHHAAERAAMLEAIASARETRDARVARSTRLSTGRVARSTTTSDSTATTLDITDNTGDTSDWQKRALGTLNRLLGQCFDLGRTEDPTLAGTVVVRFTLVGEPGVGGLLERVEVVDTDTTITQRVLRECVTEQLYALELDPPPDGVRIERELHLEVP